MSKYIIDRRKNPKGKSISNRQRFIRRAKKHLSERIHKNVVKRSITDKGEENISIPTDGIQEPSFNHDSTTGDYDFVLPGNKEFIKGDTIGKPPKGGGGGAGKEASDSGSGEDEFQFSLTRDEYLDIVFEDLELPNLEEKNKENVTVWETHRSGYTTVGSPSQLNIEQSMIRSLGRRIALKFPKQKEIKELEEEIKRLEEEIKYYKEEIKPMTKNRALIDDIRLQIESLRKRHRAIPFIDPIDLRFNNFAKYPKPTSSAVMICIMDVSASMGEREKELSKRFFLLLYLFLERKYENVDVIFIRHHTEAIECTEEEFFNSKETGGTIVSSGLVLANKILKERYSQAEWNSYIAQASDGDNFASDLPLLNEVLVKSILPVVKFYTYVEIAGMYEQSRSFWAAQSKGRSSMWQMYEELHKLWPNLVSKQIKEAGEIIPVFREFFSKPNALSSLNVPNIEVKEET
jgi:hypothetical protein|tara:strand:- start:282 stop:1664 length:1383 start_codon:yes stop_codon:yes gene_type:complete